MSIFDICRKLSNLVYEEVVPPVFEDWSCICHMLNAIEINRPKKSKKKSQIDCIPCCKVKNLACIAYKKDNEIIIAYRGTDDIWDILADTSFLRKKLPFSQKTAKRLYNEIKEQNPDCRIWLTGHSLGGGYAQIVAGLVIKEGDNSCSAITFNAPGVGYVLTNEEKEVNKTKINSRITNYVVMNDFVGNFREHLGLTYYCQPYPLNVPNPNKPKEKRTAHGCIKEAPIDELGVFFSCPLNWNSKLAWALYVFDENEVPKKEQIIRSALDARVNVKHLKQAINIIKAKQDCKDGQNHLKLLNSFKFKAGFKDKYKAELVANR